MPSSRLQDGSHRWWVVCVGGRVGSWVGGSARLKGEMVQGVLQRGPAAVDEGAVLERGVRELARRSAHLRQKRNLRGKRTVDTQGVCTSNWTCASGPSTVPSALTSRPTI